MRRPHPLALPTTLFLFACAPAPCPPLKSTAALQLQSSDAGWRDGWSAAVRERSYYNWALAVCLGEVSLCDSLTKDSKATSGAYLEQGELGTEVYEAMHALAKEYAARHYEGSVPGEFHIKKCIDLFESEELRTLITEAVAEEARLAAAREAAELK